MATQRPRRMLRRIGAVLAGLLAIVALSTATDMALHATGVYPPVGAPPLGAIGLAISIAGAVAMWEAGPAWYSLAVIAIALPCAWAGGRLHGTRASAIPAGTSRAAGQASPIR